MKKFRKVISIVMVMVMLLSMLPVIVANASDDYVELELKVMQEVPCDGNEYTYAFTPAKNGWYKFTSYSIVGDPYAQLFDADFEEIGYSDDENEFDYCLVEKLYAGCEYYFVTSTYEENIGEIFTFTVDEAVVPVSMEIVKEPDKKTVIKDYGYETLDYTGLQIEFTLSDSSKVLYTAYESDKAGDVFVDIEEGDDGQDNYYIDITCGEVSARYFFETVEPNVKSIEYNCDEEISIYENSDGYYHAIDECFYYNYEIPESAKITVTYNDNTTEEAYFWDGLNGIPFDSFELQDIDPWTVGSDNYVYVSYLGVQTQVPVTIKETPIKNVTVLTPPSKTYYHYDDIYGYFYEDGFFIAPSDLTGLSFEVEFKDGTKKIHTDAEVDDFYGTIAGERYFIDEIFGDYDTTTYQASLRYMGYEINYDFNVVECPIESIEFVKDADKLQYEDYYYPILSGLQVKINYKDGTSKYIDVTDDNVECVDDYKGFRYIIRESGEEIIVKPFIDEEDNYCFSFKCCGYIENYYGFTFEYTRTPEQVTFGNVTEDGDGMTVTVTYEDGSVDKLNFDVLTVEHDDERNRTEVYAMTENGIAYYSIKIMDFEDTPHYLIYLFSEFYEVMIENAPVIVGDVDGDSEISVMDATKIQRYLVQQEEFTDAQAFVANVDGDEEISVMDATTIQRYIAQIITEF